MSELIHVLATNEQLITEAYELSHHRDEPYLTEARKQQITRQMSYIFFELQVRNEIVLIGPEQQVA